MKLSPLEYWEVASKKVVRSDPSIAWVERARNILMNFASDEIFDPFGGLRQLSAEPHALGWLYQSGGESARREAFEKHVQSEAKHLDMVTTTQVFTPRWVADYLCHYAIRPSTQTVHDPTCGTGQMLLAAYDRLRAFGASPSECLEMISGADLDPGAVDIARDVLKLRVRQDENVRGLETKIARAIVVRDVLDGIDSADVVITNPPFMGRRSMSDDIRESVAKWGPYDIDLFSTVIKICQEAANQSIAIVAPQVFWFLHRFEPLRRELLSWGHLDALALLGEKTFRTLTGSKSNAAAFVQHRGERGETRCDDVRRLETDEKRDALMAMTSITVDVQTMEKLPGFPMAFWLEPPLIDAFERFTPLGELVDIPGGQNKTGDNAQFVAAIESVSPDEIRACDAWPAASGDVDARWVVYSKGGPFAPWWGNWNWVVDWSEDARSFYAQNPTSNLLSDAYWFRRGLCYSDFGSVGFSARLLPEGCLFDMTGPAIFVDDDDPDLLFGLMVVLNSTPVRAILGALNPSLHTQVKDVRRIPVPDTSTIREFASSGRELVDLVRRGDRRFLELEATLDDEVCALYGSRSPRDRLVHHAYV